MDIVISYRDGEADDPQPILLWDTIYDPINKRLDWALAGPNATGNAYGLQANRALDTAILMQLATWRRAEPYDLLPDGNDPKGWWGDSVDIEDGEQMLGSRLWLLYRSKLDDSVAALAKNYILEALQPLITQGAVVRFDVTISIRQVQGVLEAAISGYSQDGSKIYDQRFAKLWQQEFA